MESLVAVATKIVSAGAGWFTESLHRPDNRTPIAKIRGASHVPEMHPEIVLIASNFSSPNYCLSCAALALLRGCRFLRVPFGLNAHLVSNRRLVGTEVVESLTKFFEDPCYLFGVRFLLISCPVKSFVQLRDFGIRFADFLRQILQQ